MFWSKGFMLLLSYCSRKFLLLKYIYFLVAAVTSSESSDEEEKEDEGVIEMRKKFQKELLEMRMRKSGVFDEMLNDARDERKNPLLAIPSGGLANPSI